MNHQEKVQYVQETYGEVVKIPNLYKLFWKVGWKTPPPVFQSFPELLVSDIFFVLFIATFAGVFDFLLFRDDGEWSTLFAFLRIRYWIILIVLGHVWAVIDWQINRWIRKKHNLPRWRDIEPEL